MALLCILSRTNVASVGSIFNDTRKVKVLSLPETIKEKSTFRAFRREVSSAFAQNVEFFFIVLGREIYTFPVTVHSLRRMMIWKARNKQSLFDVDLNHTVNKSWLNFMKYKNETFVKHTPSAQLMTIIFWSAIKVIINTDKELLYCLTV